MQLVSTAIVSPVWLSLGTSMLVLLYAASQQQFQVGESTLDEVPVFLRRLNWDEVCEVFNRAREQYIWMTQTGYNLRRTTRANILKAREFISRMCHNAHIVQEWANTELEELLNGSDEYSVDKMNQLRETARIAAEFRSLSRMRLLKLSLWTVLRAERWPLKQVPSIASLRNLGANGEIDLIVQYEKLKKGAANLARPYGQQFQDHVLSEL
jgi:hypothetical protein